jgi:hypothetical protein
MNLCLPQDFFNAIHESPSPFRKLSALGSRLIQKVLQLIVLQTVGGKSKNRTNPKKVFDVSFVLYRLSPAKVRALWKDHLCHRLLISQLSQDHPIDPGTPFENLFGDSPGLPKTFRKVHLVE